MTYYEVLERISMELEPKISEIMEVMQNQMSRLRYVGIVDDIVKANYSVLARDISMELLRVVEKKSSLDVIIQSLDNIKIIYKDSHQIEDSDFYKKYITDEESVYNLNNIRCKLLEIPRSAVELSQSGEKDEIIYESIKENVSRVVDEIFNELQEDIKVLLEELGEKE